MLSPTQDPMAEVLRLTADLAGFDHDLAELKARMQRRPQPWHRLELAAQQSARQATVDALEVWLHQLEGMTLQ